jgi:putative CocE/NonD family hydrolase
MIPATINGTGPVDQRPVETREDVLCFTTEVLEHPVEVTGHVSLVLHMDSTTRDTHFTGKLVDVFPDGKAIHLTDGILRARYRNSLAQPEPLEPGTVYEAELNLWVTSNVAGALTGGPSTQPSAGAPDPLTPSSPSTSGLTSQCRSRRRHRGRHR